MDTSRKVQKNTLNTPRVLSNGTERTEIETEHPQSNKYRTDYEVMIVLQSPKAYSPQDLVNKNGFAVETGSSKFHQLSIIETKLDGAKFWLTV